MRTGARARRTEPSRSKELDVVFVYIVLVPDGTGGEQRRLNVGTVLATSPEVIFLDEPTFGQDRNTWLDLVGLVGQILAEGRTIVSVTHDPNYLTVLGEHRIGLVGHHG